MSEAEKNTDNKLLEVIAESQKTISNLLRQQQRAAKWKALFFALLFAPGILMYLTVFWAIGEEKMNDQPILAVINADGIVGQTKGITADRVIKSLENAYGHERVKEVVLRVDSPGGSPVAGKMIRDAMVRLRTEFPEKKLTVIGQGTLASAAYMIAVGADNIAVQPASVVGSIGVIRSSWNASEFIEKLGVQRYVLTAGTNKAALDPFMSVNPDHERRMLSLLDEIHQQFINDVKIGRGDKLQKAKDVDLFQGDFWTGETAVVLGLADEIASLDYMMSTRYKDYEQRDFTDKPTVIDRLNGGVAAISGLRQLLHDQLGGEAVYR